MNMNTDNAERLPLDALRRFLAERAAGGKPYVTERELGEFFRVSRSMLRETLQTLDAYGMIEKRQKLGVRLRPVSDEEWQEALDVRSRLEAYAIGIAVTKITPADIAGLRRLDASLEAALAADRRDEAVFYENRLHSAIVRISGCRMVLRMLEHTRLLEHTLWAADGHGHPDEPAPVSHRMIIDALEARDPKCAELIAAHIEWGK